MKKQLNIMLTMIIALMIQSSLAAQEIESRSFDSFDGISVSASINAELIKGNKNEVVITATNVDLNKVITEIKSGTLKIGMKNKGWGKWTKRKKVAVVVTYTEDLENLSVSSSADVSVHDVISSDRLKIKASSSGDIQLEVKVKELTVNVSSSADLEISGIATDAFIKASSSADFEGRDLVVDDAELKASSSADIEISVKNSIEARASSGADIIYYGSPKHKDVSKSSGGDIDRRSGR